MKDARVRGDDEDWIRQTVDDRLQRELRAQQLAERTRTIGAESIGHCIELVRQPDHLVGASQRCSRLGIPLAQAASCPRENGDRAHQPPGQDD